MALEANNDGLIYGTAFQKVCKEKAVSPKHEIEALCAYDYIGLDKDDPRGYLSPTDLLKMCFQTHNTTGESRKGLEDGN